MDVPTRVTKALDAEGRIPVRGTVEGVPYASTLMPRGGGRHRLFVHSRVWRPRGLEVGDEVRVRIERDVDAEAVGIPPWLAAAFRRRPAARRAFGKLSYALRREVVGYLSAARRPETRERRLEMMLDRLESGPLRRE